MKAIQFTRYGPPSVLKMIETEKPSPKDDEVLIRVRATTVTSAETGMRQGLPRWGRVIIGFTGPRRKFRILGIELAGDVESVGRDVRRFRPGDQVFGFAGFNPGANAEYMCLPATASLAVKPANKSYEEAVAAVDGASTALFFLRDKANVQPGQRVLINGAAGSIGTYAVQLAKRFGAEVTGVCGTRNVALVQSLGADHVIDYTAADFTRNGETYDVIFDTVGKSSFARSKGSLAPAGRFVATTGVANFLLAVWTRVRPGRKVVIGMSVEKNEALTYLRGLIEADELRIVIDKRFPLERIVEAHEYVDKGHKVGNVVITM